MRRNWHQKMLDLRRFFFMARLHHSTIASKHQVRKSQNAGALTPAQKTCADRACFKA